MRGFYTARELGCSGEYEKIYVEILEEFPHVLTGRMMEKVRIHSTVLVKDKPEPMITDEFWTRTKYLKEEENAINLLKKF